MTAVRSIDPLPAALLDHDADFVDAFRVLWVV